MSKCRVCKGPAVIDLPRHNANFCAEHLEQLCRRQVEKAIHDFEMLQPGDRVLVAVSGGKDSLAVWDILLELGYEVDGLHVGLGIGTYSDESGEYARSFAASRGVRLQETDLRHDHGFDIPTAARATRRVPCSACGMSKRHLFDAAARDGGYDAVATGHNLDDEAAVLLGSALRWDVDSLARQLPVLPAGRGFPRKVKPLVRLTERETAAWCVVRGLDYQVEECPMAAGNRHLTFKATLNDLEARSPGTKSAFYLNFLDNLAPLLTGRRAAATDTLTPCSSCVAPTPGPGLGGAQESRLCAFCRLVETASTHDPVTVEMLTAKHRR